MSDKTFYSYDQIHEMCKVVAERIKNNLYKPSLIVGIIRGGTIPATILSHMLDIPIKTISYSSKAGAGNNKNHDNIIPEDILHTKNVIFVDELVDSGRTLKEIITDMESVGNYSARTAVLIYKDHEHQQHIPNFYATTTTDHSTWVVFPWETQT